MQHIKKWGPIGAAGFAGAALADMLTKDKSALIRVIVGVALVGGAVAGAASVGLAKV
jgi:orotate phosphoribosyltransferase-like protein